MIIETPPLGATRPPIRAALLQIVRRLFLLVCALVLALVAWNSLTRSAVQDPLNMQLSPAQQAQLQERGGDDGTWLFGGVSFTNGLPVGRLIVAHIGSSAAYFAWALVLALACGGLAALLAAGVDRLEARRPALGFPLKVLARIPAMLWLALPLLGLGLLLRYQFAVATPLLPLLGDGPANAAGGLVRAPYAVLPLLTLVGLPATLIASAAYVDWQRGAWATGIFSLLSGLGRAVLALVAALFAIEPLFRIPGVGTLAAESAAQRDLPTLSGCVQLVLLVAFGGLVLAVFGDGLARLLRPVVPAPSPLRPNRWHDRIWIRLALASLLIPVAALLLASSVDQAAANVPNIANRAAAPSAALPFGNDQLGRSIYTRSLVGMQVTATTAGLAVALGVFGVGWGVLAAALSRWRGALGESLADILLLPALVVRLVPLLVGALAWQALFAATAERGPMLGLLFGTLIVPRAALAAHDTLADRAWHWGLVLRSIAGVMLLSFGAVVVAAFTLDALGFGTPPPTPSLGGVVGEQLNTIIGTSPLPLLGPLLLTFALSGPCLFASWVLPRSLHRGNAIGIMYS